MRFALFLLTVLITCLSTPTWADKAGKKPIPIPQDMSKAIKHSPFPAPVNHCDPNKPQDLEQDCSEDPLHMYKRLMLESFLNLHEEQMKNGLSIPEYCGCAERAGFAYGKDNPLLKWRNDRCLENCNKVFEKCDLSSSDYDRKVCIQKFFEVEVDYKNSNKEVKQTEVQKLPEEITEDPLHKWRRLQEERISKETNPNPNDPCSKSLRAPLTDLYCFFKRESDEMKITEKIEKLKSQPEKYSQKRTECGCKETIPDETDPLWKWRESTCMKNCLRKDKE